MTEEIKYQYVLLDWGGNIEDECLMTESEAEEKNRYLFETESRLLRWAKKN